MTRPRVVFVGSRPLGRFALELLLQRSDIELVGKVVLEDYKSGYWTEDPADLQWPPNLSIDELASADFDLGIAVNYWGRIRSPIVEQPRLGFFQVHHSYNLMYRWMNVHTHAILEARNNNRWYHGTTLHRLSPTMDTGGIVASRDVPLSERDTARSLFEKVEQAARTMLVDWLPRLWQGSIEITTPSGIPKYFLRKDIPPRLIDPSLGAQEIYDLVRALTFPPIERPYFLDAGAKVYLTIDGNESLGPVRDAGDGRIVFAMRAT